MKIQWNRINRKTHYWGALICALPVLIMILSGLVLLLKKEVAWIQPPSQKGSGEVPLVSFEKILTVIQKIPEAEISTWNDVDRIDVRPGKGILKVLSGNRWEIQLHHETGEVLQVAYRRSDLIESIHDGSFFHERAKLWVFLPSAIILLILWVSGIWLFLLPILAKRRRKRKNRT
ncbi:MAG: PepSY-associated TM helix domain-containing protein [Verrucomicrobiales bacterium]|nr:PepSY-associated TM helix domain-containing protein [Verrucomicrobiales bacterium]